MRLSGGSAFQREDAIGYFSRVDVSVSSKTNRGNCENTKTGKPAEKRMTGE